MSSSCQSIDQRLDALADALVGNHLDLTLGDNHTVRQLMLKAEHQKLASCTSRRVVVVVGAGASVPAGIPSTNDAKKALRERVRQEDRGSLDRMVEDWHGASSRKGYLDPEQLETMLQAACENGLRDIVVDELGRLFNKRYPSTLSYELIAHMLKHRFVDAVINFNFDELLDQSIENELGTGRYSHIVSDGDCEFLKQRHRAPDRHHQPIYLKPHGTVSAPATMRFTLPDYYGVTPEIMRLMRQLLSDVPVTLIVVGFGMQSMEFNDVVDACMATSDCSVFNFTLHRDEYPRPHCSEACRSLYEKGGHIPVAPNDPLDGRLRMLWSRVTDRFSQDFQPRGVERHELVSQLSSHLDIATPSGACAYLRRRAVCELAISVAKAKCFVSTRVLLNGRVGTYLRLYRDALAKGATPEWDTIYAMCRAIGLRECSFSREVLSLPDEGGKPQPRAMSKRSFRDYVLPQWFLMEVMRAGCLPIDLRDELQRVLSAMHESDEVEVVAPRLAIGLELCDHPEYFDTLAALKAHTRWEIENGRWDTILCVAETGEWLNNTKIAQQCNGKKVVLIVAEPTILEGALRERYGSVLVTPRRPLAWWLHNQHMTLFVRDGQPYKAIQFERRLRNTRIAPVMVKGDDASYLMKCFGAYWVKAEHHEVGVVTDEDIDAAIKMLLSGASAR